MRAAYRAGQFWKALTAVPDQNGIELAQEILSPALMALFLKMHPSEMSHSLEIARGLIAAGETNPDLLAAALLHDVGKSLAPLQAWERAVIVLGQLLFPHTCRRWGNSGSMQSWKRMFVVAEKHPAWGAELAARAGATRLTTQIIRRHQDPHQNLSTDGSKPGNPSQEDYLLNRLQLLDGGR